MVRTSDLRVKEVINLVDGRRLGTIVDLDVDLERGTVLALVLPGASPRMFGLLGRAEEIVIPWQDVEKVGVDTILVRLTQVTPSPR